MTQEQWPELRSGLLMLCILFLAFYGAVGILVEQHKYNSETIITVYFFQSLRVSNSSSSSQVDNPTKWNPDRCGSHINLLENNTLAQRAASGDFQSVLGTRGISDGKWFWEFTVVSLPLDADVFIGIAHHTVDVDGPGAFRSQKAYMFHNDGGLWHENVRTPQVAPFSQGDSIGLLLDMYAHTLTIYKNSMPLGVAFRNLEGEFFPIVDLYGVGTEVAIRDRPVSAPHYPPYLI